MLAAIAFSALMLYADALRHFNPALGRTRAVALARTTIEQADANALDARLLVALIAVESRWDPNAVSPAGARGLGQLMPATAQELAVDPFDPLQNIDGVARQLRALLDRYRSVPMALAAYNAGGGAVDRFNGVPPFPEPRRYVSRVIALWRRLEGG